MAGWTSQQLERIDSAQELRIATTRPDGTLTKAVPIWVVRVGEDAYVRTWHRRDTGWFGRAVRDPRARVEVPGFEADVLVEDVGARLDEDELREAVDAAYRAKYGHPGDPYVSRMVTPESVATTLRLVPA